MSKAGRNGHGRGQKSEGKQAERRRDTKKGFLSGRGPVGLFVAKVIDMLIFVVIKTVKFFWYELTIPTFNFINNLLFSEFHGVFAGKEKEGECYNSSVFRYLINILVPPLGIFLSKGMNGWPSIIISTVLTFFHIFPGIIYTFIVTHNSRYAERYQKRELEQIEKRRIERGDNHTPYGMVSLLTSIGVLAIIVYLLMLLAKFASGLTNNHALNDI